jgi:hypothetical protein
MREVINMTETGSRTFYHGTIADLKPGDMLQGGFPLTTRSERYANDLDGSITDGAELTHSYSVESNNEVKMTKAEIVSMIERAGFEAVDPTFNS